MTNCVYTRHQGKKTPQDVSYCLKTLQNITKDEWLCMCNVSGAKLGNEKDMKQPDQLEDTKIEEKVEEVQKIEVKKIVKPKLKSRKIVIPSKEEIRSLREAFYTNK